MGYQFRFLIIGPVISDPYSADFECIAKLMSGSGEWTGFHCKHVNGQTIMNLGRQVS